MHFFLSFTDKLKYKYSIFVCALGMPLRAVAAGLLCMACQAGPHHIRCSLSWPLAECLPHYVKRKKACRGFCSVLRWAPVPVPVCVCVCVADGQAILSEREVGIFQWQCRPIFKMPHRFLVFNLPMQYFLFCFFCLGLYSDLKWSGNMIHLRDLR